MNLFLTGETRVGKTTIINRLLADLKLTPSGFRTFRLIVDGKHVGFVMEDLTGTVPAGCRPLYIAQPGPRGCWEPLPATFENWGARILQASLASPQDLILMDELGHFETTAFHFQERVLECLAAPVPVLAVVKQRSTPFLDRIRSRRDVTVLTVTEDNRNEQYEKIKALLRLTLSGKGTAERLV